ncbi:MAG: DMT family transporter [Litorimonas sp.]
MAGNFVVSAWVLGGNNALFPNAVAIPPFMLAATRAAIVLVFMFPFLKLKKPQRWLRLLLVCACVGPIHLGLLYTGLMTAPASGSSVVSQMMIPFATILSVIFLRERIGATRIIGIVGAFIGTIIMIYEPGALSLDTGLLYVLAAFFTLAVGSVLMKTVGDVDWQQYVAWMAAMVLPVMAAASALFESNHNQVWTFSLVPLLIAATYAAVCASIVAHGQYFNLIKRYDVSVVVPLTLMIPVFASILGVLFLKETIFPRYYVGAAFILPCVFLIAKRSKSVPAQGR